MGECLTEVDFERYALGALQDAERERFEAHLGECERCRSSCERRSSKERSPAAAQTVADASSGTDQTLSATPGPAVAAEPYYPQIEGYLITGVAGRGGMGIVYEAYQRALNRKVAREVLPAILSTASPDAVARFRREATAAAKLHHTNIIPIYDFGEARDGHYYAMELIEGTSLDKVVRRLATENISATSATRLAELLQTRGSPGQAPAGRSERPDSPPASPVPAPPPAREVESSSGCGGRGRMYFRQITRWI
ncbi:MAG: protein kinase domain-containing protein, partial [Planctomycetota bacterium]